MGIFQGAAALTLDAKGRLAIPARHRDALSAEANGALVLTAHPHGCLLLFPAPAWEPILSKILKASSFDTRAMALKRVLVGNALELEMDAAGRLLISPELRDHAKFEKTVRFVGMGSHFEIWSDEGWQRQNDAAKAVMASDQPVVGFEDISL